MKEKRKITTTEVVTYSVLAITVVVLVFSFSILMKMIAWNNQYKEGMAEADKINNAITSINAIYDKYAIKNEQVVDPTVTAIRGYVEGLNDKYAYYLSPEETSQEDMVNNEESVGLGVLTVAVKNGYMVYKVFDGTTAATNGIKIGDILTQVNDIKYDASNPNDLIKEIQNNKDKSIDVHICHVLNNDAEDFQTEEVVLQLTPSDYETKSVSSYEINGYTVIQIDKFTNKTYTEFKDCIDSLTSKGVSEFIIDLRNNTGGSLDTIIAITDYIVQAGTLVKVTDKDGNVEETIMSDDHEIMGEFVVLTNNGTASASEFFAQTIKDFNKGITVGTKSYGKGTVITGFDIKNGGRVWLSTGYYLTNSGAMLEGVGVEPDIEVELDVDNFFDLYTMSHEEDTQLQAAVDYLEHLEYKG